MCFFEVYVVNEWKEAVIARARKLGFDESLSSLRRVVSTLCFCNTCPEPVLRDLKRVYLVRKDVW